MTGERYEDRVRAGSGGVMTDEVGVVTGELTVVTRALVADGEGGATVDVRYTGAEESYTLTGCPVAVPAGGLAELHSRVLERVRRGGAARAPG
ncbi:hypothetical protein [Streptomyces sp. NPDC005438]|uniref:hypothetical protein n=1 Tax=Streptomyces sp. NPDC005438 TaxID=3156880 RepID=UPI0033AC4178